MKISFSIDFILNYVLLKNMKDICFHMNYEIVKTDKFIEICLKTKRTKLQKIKLVCCWIFYFTTLDYKHNENNKISLINW